MAELSPALEGEVYRRTSLSATLLREIDRLREEYRLVNQRCIELLTQKEFMRNEHAEQTRKWELRNRLSIETALRLSEELDEWREKAGELAAKLTQFERKEGPR